MYKAKVNITLRKSILDPKGKAAHHALQNLGLNDVQDVRIGKFIEMNIDAESQDEARKFAHTCLSHTLSTPLD
jgi:phosphoribosylformylglycinamidine synthase